MIVGRDREVAGIGRLLERAAAGSGGVLVLTGPVGSGRTTLLDLAAETARDQRFEVLRGSPAAGQPGRLVWAQLLRDLGHPAGALMDESPGPIDLDEAACRLASGGPRLIVVDDIDRGGADAVEVLSVLAARVVAGPTAVVVTATEPLGIGSELRLRGLTEAELAGVVGDLPLDVRQVLAVASRGLPGVARSLAADLSALEPGGDPLVHLALKAQSTATFLDVDVALIGLLERALDRVSDERTRARVLARLGYELLGDASAGGRRRSLIDEALELARSCDDKRLLAEVLDARLHALWDPAAGEDRLDTATEIVEIARLAGDGVRERRGLFWRFVSLMELGRIGAAESALVTFERAAELAGDAEDMVMAISRHAMLAILRGRFDDADRLTDEVAVRAAQLDMPDADRLVGTLRGAGRWERDLSVLEAGVEAFRYFSRRLPGHFVEATGARFLAMLGRKTEASVELERILPSVLAGTGPRWIGALSDLTVAATLTGNVAAGKQLYDALLPYRDRYAIWGGANTAMGPVSYYLGLLATQSGRSDQALEHFTDAIDHEEREGALPWLARSLAGSVEALLAMGAGDRAAEHLRRARSIAERLGMTTLLDELSRPADEWTLRQDDGDWVLEAGDERARLRDGRGPHYLRALLRAPHRDIPAVDLVAGRSGVPVSANGPMLDGKAAAAYRRRLAELDDELAAADRAGDGERAERADAERKALLDELRKASGLSGRTRELAPQAERARVNVTRTLRATIDRIAETAPRCAAHLQASIRTGRDCRYQPTPGGPARWHT